jgi:hypothetical protein
LSDPAIVGAVENEGATRAVPIAAVDAAMATAFGVVPLAAVAMTVTYFATSVDPNV